MKLGMLCELGVCKECVPGALVWCGTSTEKRAREQLHKVGCTRFQLLSSLSVECLDCSCYVMG